MKAKVKGNVVREMLLRRNESLTAFAARIVVSEAALTNWLNGERHPEPVNRAKLLEALGTDFDTIFEVVNGD